MKILFFILYAILFSSTSFSQQKNGVIRGKVIDEYTQSPVEGAVVELINTDQKTGTNEFGEFIFTNLSYDTYRLRVSSIGYNDVLKSDLTVYASKPLEVNIILIPQGIVTEEINVNANFFQKSSDLNISSVNLDYEEIRRAPGATEDISRMLQTAPGVAIGNDQRNDLIVRGGSPSENLLLIDGIDIPNINHFGTQGSTSGGIGFINSKFILDANMLTGGFPSLYGDRLSGVVKINFREGSREGFFNDINLSIAGFGGAFEGPILNKGSYLLSVRRSYLELIKSSIRLTAVPNYWDINFKAVYDFSSTDKLSFISLVGLDKINFSGETEEDNPYGRADSDQKTIGAGFNFKKLIARGYIETVLSNAFTDHNIIQFEYAEGDEIIFKSISYENELIFKSSLNYQIERNFILNTGIGGKYISIKNLLYLRGDTSYAGYIYDTINADTKINTSKFFSHVNFTSKLFDDMLILNTGVRVDYFDYIEDKFTFSPRLGATYNLSGVTSLNAAFGIYYQTPAYIWISSHPLNQKLKNLRSYHSILGIDHYFSADIKASMEIYNKDYNNYPVWKDIPTYILIDGGADFGPNIIGEAVSAGTGYVRGIDLFIQKKLSKTGLYGLINYSYIFSRFKALAGNEKPGAYDPGHQFTFIAGYQFNSGWLLGFKFKYSGGRPFTPIDEEASRLVGRGVFATDNFNSERYPYYMRIDLRIDKKINFKSASLVAYIELQNVLNRPNIFRYFWNEAKNQPGTIYQWAFFPVGGVSVQF